MYIKGEAIINTEIWLFVDDEYQKDIVLTRVAAGFFGNAYNLLIDMFPGRLPRGG